MSKHFDDFEPEPVEPEPLTAEALAALRAALEPEPIQRNS